MTTNSAPPLPVIEAIQFRKMQMEPALPSGSPDNEPGFKREPGFKKVVSGGVSIVPELHWSGPQFAK
jgi:hypothetical protein